MSIPVTKSDWSANTGAEIIEGAKGKIVAGHIKGSRSGSEWTFEASVSVDDVQPDLFPSNTSAGPSSVTQDPT